MADITDLERYRWIKEEFEYFLFEILNDSEYEYEDEPYITITNIDCELPAGFVEEI